MDELMDMIISDESPANISDKIKEIIQVKSMEKIDSLRPYVASSIFGDGEYKEDANWK